MGMALDREGRQGGWAWHWTGREGKEGGHGIEQRSIKMKAGSTSSRL
jgi:hypothetical protein